MRGQIAHDNQAQFDTLYDQLSYQSVRYGAGRSREVETICPISPVGSFLGGIALDLKRLEPDIEIDNKFLSYHFPNIGNGLTDLPVSAANTKWTYRSYQADAIIKAAKIGRGIIDSPTASGKSIIMYGLIEHLEQMKTGKILVLVPNPGLVTQLCDDFRKYGLEDYAPYKKGGNTERVVIISRTMVKKAMLDTLRDYEHIIIDEVHKLSSGSSYEKVIKAVDTKSIFGMTATMPEDKKEEWFIRGMVGPILYKAHAHELQEQNFLARINIVSIKFTHSSKPEHIANINYDVQEHPTRAYTDEYQHLETHINSNRYITDLVNKLSGNTMILFDHTAHGRALFDALSGNKLFVDGSVSMDDREDIKARLEDENDLVLVAQSTCFGTGISINNIKNLVICSHSKRLTKIIQQVGRGLRKTVDGSEYMYLFDFHHNFKYSERHWGDRSKLYKKFYNKSYDKRIKVTI